MTALNNYRVSYKSQSIESNTDRNAESLLKDLTGINTFEEKAITRCSYEVTCKMNK